MPDAGPHAVLQSLDLEETEDVVGYAFLQAAAAAPCRDTIKHASLTPTDGCGFWNWSYGPMAAYVIGLLPGLPGLESARLPLSCSMPEGWIASVLHALPSCRAVILVKEPCECDEESLQEGDIDCNAEMLKDQLSGYIPALPHLRELELAGLRFDRGCTEGGQRCLRQAFRPLVGLSTLRLRTTGHEDEWQYGSVDHEPVVKAASSAMPRLHSIEAACEGADAEEVTVVLFPRPSKAEESTPQEQPEVETEEEARGAKRGRDCDGCGCEVEAGPGVCPRKWRRRTA